MKKLTISLLLAAIHFAATSQVTMGFSSGFAMQKKSVLIQDFAVDPQTGAINIQGYHSKNFTNKAITGTYHLGYRFNHVDIENNFTLMLGAGFLFTEQAGYRFDISENISFTPFIGFTNYWQLVVAPRIQVGGFFLSLQRIGFPNQFLAKGDNINSINIGFGGTIN